VEKVTSNKYNKKGAVNSPFLLVKSDQSAMAILLLSSALFFQQGISGKGNRCYR
jgi:hypothetical protein